ncbi:hypothetical protein GDO81_015090 [Engystomops pustulosus]|uniref:Secreted protein n=1 Tax=Engystomops pustulosus TaxID=76066 RepID=A0AAV7ANH3_ENGPU|nr:hypothetical protein GDO81_015090 [Engystomops pustulosus]
MEVLLYIWILLSVFNEHFAFFWCPIFSCLLEKGRNFKSVAKDSSFSHRGHMDSIQVASFFTTDHSVSHIGSKNRFNKDLFYLLTEQR